MTCPVCEKVVGDDEVRGRSSWCAAGYLRRVVSHWRDWVAVCFAHQDGVNALDKNWHREHFVCAECGCGFDDGVYFSKDADDGRGERPYCEADFMELFVPKVGTVSRCGYLRM